MEDTFKPHLLPRADIFSLGILAVEVSLSDAGWDEINVLAERVTAGMGGVTAAVRARASIKRGALGGGGGAEGVVLGREEQEAGPLRARAG